MARYIVLISAAVLFAGVSTAKVSAQSSSSPLLIDFGEAVRTDSRNHQNVGGIPGRQASYEFTARAGQPIWIDAVARSPGICTAGDCRGFLAYRLRAPGGSEICPRTSGGAVLAGTVHRVGQCILPITGTYRFELLTFPNQITEFTIESAGPVPVQVVQLDRTIEDAFSGSERPLPFDDDQSYARVYHLRLPRDARFNVQLVQQSGTAASARVFSPQGEYLPQDRECRQYRAEEAGLYEVRVTAPRPDAKYSLTARSVDPAAYRAGSGSGGRILSLRELPSRLRLPNGHSFLNAELHPNGSAYVVRMMGGRGVVEETLVDAYTGVPLARGRGC